MTNTPKHREHGFTLLEILLAITIASMMIVSILSVFRASLFAREEVKALSEPMTTGPRILDMIEEDVRALWTFNVQENRILRGENRDFVGDEADRMHMIVCGRTSQPVLLPDDSTTHAPLAEVSYLVRGNTENAQFLELWRREDPMFDVEWTKGGFYQLLSDRVRSFQIQYFEDLGKEAEEFDEWDTTERRRLPRRIKIELEIERRSDSFNKLVETEEIGRRRLKYTRHIVLPKDWMAILEPGVAIVPAVPMEHPTAENAPGPGGPIGGRGGRQGQNEGPKGATRVQAGGDQGARSGKNTPLPFPGRGKGSGSINDLLKGLGGGSRGNTGGKR